MKALNECTIYKAGLVDCSRCHFWLFLLFDMSTLWILASGKMKLVRQICNILWYCSLGSHRKNEFLHVILLVEMNSDFNQAISTTPFSRKASQITNIGLFQYFTVFARLGGHVTFILEIIIYLTATSCILYFQDTFGFVITHELNGRRNPHWSESQCSKHTTNTSKM